MTLPDRTPKVSQPQLTHLRALPYSVAWAGRDHLIKPFPSFNTATHDRLAARGWLRRFYGEIGKPYYDLTPLGRDVLAAQEALKVSQ